jgi:surface protein
MVENEKKLRDYPRPIFIEENELITEQMKTTICKISTEAGEKGTGFFCKIPIPHKELKVFVTNNHVINEEVLEKKKPIYVSINNKPKEIKLKDKFTYTNKEFDATIVEIKENLDDITHFLELDENQIIVDYIGSSIYTLQYPSFNEMQKPAVSYGILKKRYSDKEYDFIHYCSTEHGSSGSPILNLSNFKIIGIHKQAKVEGQYNIGVFIYYIIQDFIAKYNNRKNQYEGYSKKESILKEIKADPISKDEIRIKYKIDNPKEIRLFGDKFVENNKNKCKIIIDKKEEKLIAWWEIDKAYKNEEFLEITLNGLTKVTNMSHIFNGCSTLISFDDISNLDMKNVTDISFMFYGCSSIEAMPDISNWDTSKVTDIESIFSYCQKIRYLPDISKWKTDNVTNMSYIFYECSALLSIPNISKWNTSKVSQLNSIFSRCSSITSLPDISNWNTENVINMGCMFERCTNLNYLPDLSYWNTKNVTDMDSMFSSCSSLKSLPDISKWNTSNVTTMRNMFSYCTSLENLPDINKWNINKVENMNFMFLNCQRLNNIPSKFA